MRPDDLRGDAVRALVALHLAQAHATSPPGSVFALELVGLRGPDISVWSAWRGTALAGVAALKRVSDSVGELKSMRTHPDHLRTGVAACLLEFIIEQAAVRGFARLSLETGSGPAFEPALALYRKRGFVEGEAFAGYTKSAFNRFFHLTL